MQDSNHQENSDSNNPIVQANIEQAPINPPTANFTSQSPVSVASTQKKSKSSVIVIVFLTIMLAGSLGFIYWQNFINKNSATNTDNSKTDTETSDVKTFNDARIATSEIIDKVLANNNLVNTFQEIEKTTDIMIEQANAAPVWKVDGTNRYISYNDQDASSIQINIYSNGDSKQWTAKYDEVGGYVKAVFDSHNLTKISNTNVGIDTYYNYAKDDLICATSYEPEMAASVINVSCGQKSKYTTKSPEYVSLKPLFDAYEAKNEKTSDGVTMTKYNMVVANGKDGYLNTWVQVSNSAAVFYKAPGGDWAYFASMQGAPICSAYNTDALKSAFAYKTCYDEAAKANTNVLKYYKL